MIDFVTSEIPKTLTLTYKTFQLSFVDKLNEYRGVGKYPKVYQAYYSSGNYSLRLSYIKYNNLYYFSQLSQCIEHPTLGACSTDCELPAIITVNCDKDLLNPNISISHLALGCHHCIYDYSSEYLDASTHIRNMSINMKTVWDNRVLLFLNHSKTVFSNLNLVKNTDICSEILKVYPKE